ncbi:indolethylamine N-methyltransferase-like [Spea bombifrons]|uniref:indolethylamine N-methyltransferase-like n=1 Tax=Spea bombifrons TaxID=233779 RepID=UPI00234963DB|nr:indolethylamine N-methyltransferase-like [Spea bombifrons]
MDPSERRFYHSHPVDSRKLLDHYCSPTAGEAMLETTIKFPIQQVHKALSAGNIKGDTFIDITIGGIMYPLLAACEFFKDIILLKFNDECIAETEKWLNAHSEAFDWSHASKYFTELEGKGHGWQEKEERLKSKIRRVVKCDLAKENLTEPEVLPRADCLLILGILETTSEDHESFRRNLKKFASLLKPGGRLLLFVALNATKYRADERDLHYFTCDEALLTASLGEEGFAVESCEVFQKKEHTDLVDYSGIAFISAQKDSEVTK